MSDPTQIKGLLQDVNDLQSNVTQLQEIITWHESHIGHDVEALQNDLQDCRDAARRLLTGAELSSLSDYLDDIDDELAELAELAEIYDEEGDEDED